MISKGRVPAVLILGLMAIWEAGCRLSDLPDFILPPPSQVLQVAVLEAPRLLPHAGQIEELAGQG